MLLRSTDSTGLQAEREFQIAAVMCRPWRRMAGVCTLVALTAWILGGDAGFRSVRRTIGIGALGRLMEQHSEATMPPPAADPAIETLDDARAELQARAAARAEWSVERGRRVKEIQADQLRELKVQGIVTVSWLALMFVAGVTLFIAAIVGLAGAVSTRRWHGLAALWSVIATAGTVGGILGLSQWGGLPPLRDAVLLIQIVLMQSAYASAIALVLLLTRRPG